MGAGDLMRERFAVLGGEHRVCGAVDDEGGHRYRKRRAFAIGTSYASESWLTAALRFCEATAPIATTTRQTTLTPWTNESSDVPAVGTAQRLVKEGGADVVKLERAGSSVSRVRAIVKVGIPVIGHLGLTPQSEIPLGGRRAQGRSAKQAVRLLDDPLALQDADCFAVVFEGRDLPYITAMIGAENTPSIRVAERLRLTPLRNDVLLDERLIVYHLRRGDHRAVPFQR